MSTALVPKTGKSRQLDGRVEPEEVITPEDAADTLKLARLLVRILRELASLKRRWWPRKIYFEDRDVDNTGTTLYRLPHNFGGRVRYVIADWSGAASPNLRKHTSTDANTLVLTSTSTGTVTLCVEEAG